MSRVLWAVCCALLGTLGCSSSDASIPSDASGAGAVPLDQLPQRFASALCQSLEPCCDDANVAFGTEQCESQATDDFTEYVNRNSGANYDSARAGACLETLQGLLKGCSAIDEPAFASACSGVFSGSLPAGAECDNSSACASNACIYDFLKMGGFCSEMNNSVARHGKAGDGCVGECFPGSDGVETCMGTGAKEPGMPFTYCYAADGVFCAFEDAENGVCSKLLTVGSECDAPLCVAGAFCSDGVCTAQHDSGSCYGFAPVSDACSPKSYCSSAGTGTAGQCVARKPDGYSCAFAYECASSKCTRTSANNGVCGTGSAATPQICGGRFMGNLD